MAKRFTDSEKWKKVWFSELSPLHKCLWFYVLDSCSTAGIWEVNWKLASFHVGAKLDPGEVSRVFQKQYAPIDGGRKWLILDFVPFQYGGRLNPNNPAHKGALEELRRYSLVAPDYSISLPDNILKAPSKDLQSTSEGAKDTDTVTDTVMVMVKGKDKAKEMYGEFQNVGLTDDEYQKLLHKYGSEERRSRAIEILSHAKASKGYTYKSDYATFSTWVTKELEKQERQDATHRGGSKQDRSISEGGRTHTPADLRRTAALVHEVIEGGQR